MFAKLIYKSTKEWLFETRAARASKQPLFCRPWAGDGRRQRVCYVDTHSPSTQRPWVRHSLLWWGPGNRIFTGSADDFNARFLRTSASRDYIFKVCLLLLCSVTVSYPTLWPHGLYVAHQAPLSMRFPRQGFWSGLPFPSPGDLPRPGIKPVSRVLATWEASYKTVYALYFLCSHSRLLLF